VDFGAKYGKFDVTQALCGRKTVSRETKAMAAEFKALLKERLKTASYDGTVSLYIDMYTDNFRKKSHLDVHATWIDRNFKLSRAALAVRHFGPASHTDDSISAAIA